MQGPTHVLSAIALTAVVDRVLLPHLPPKVRQPVRWPLAIGGAFFLHGLLDIFARLTYHSNQNPGFTTGIMVFYAIVFLWIGRRWIWRRWRDILNVPKWRYGTAIIFGWFAVDAEHFYHWFGAGKMGYSPELGYYVHGLVEWPWLQIPGFHGFIKSLPIWYHTEQAVMVELGIVFAVTIVMYLLSRNSLVGYVKSLWRRDPLFHVRDIGRYVFAFNNRAIWE